MSIYKNAINSQNACNLSGLVHALHRDLDEIWKEANEQNKGTDWVNTHPVVRLYVEQFVHLCCGGYLDFESWKQAWEACQRKAEQAERFMEMHRERQDEEIAIERGNDRRG